jgi:hypothetical protein
MNLDQAIILFTAKTKEQLVNDGGSWSWVIKPQSMIGVKYAICVRNSDPRFDEECGHRPEPHNSAFLVGKIKGIRKIGRENDRDRYQIDFSEYATFDPVPNFRQGSVRNPVTYGDVDQALKKGLDITALDWKPMPGLGHGQLDNSRAAEIGAESGGISITEAKARLAITFGVKPSAISITVSA